MKSNEFFEKMELIDDQMVSSSNPENVGTKIKRRYISIGAIASVLACLLIVVNIVFIIPFLKEKNEEKRAPEEDVLETYSPVVGVLQAYFKSNTSGDVTIEDGLMAPGSSNMGGAYKEVTDNQVDGVIEADLFKRTSTHIFYLRSNCIYAYSIDKENSKEVGKFAYELNGADLSASNKEMYLSQDGKTATIFHTINDGSYTLKVTNLDISDPSKITQINQIKLRGRYLSSRQTNGDIVLFSKFSVSSSFDPSSPVTYVPSIDIGDGFRCMDISNLICPKVINSPEYTVVTVLSESNLEYKGSSALLSYSDITYVSQNNIYVTRGYNNAVTQGEYTDNEQLTEITRLSVDKRAGLLAKGSVIVEGYLKDQYSLDEYSGVLRAVTSIMNSKYKANTTQDDSAGSSKGTASSTLISSTVSASIYCINVNNMEITGRKDKFAPNGENVKSVRFDKQKAYVCTAIQFTDPVFAFDLSNANSIKSVDTGVIDGLSTSLVQLKNGYFLGIGSSDFNSVKLELYKETENRVESVCKHEIKNAYYSTDYKSYFIDRENGIVGIGVDEIGVNFELKPKYLIFQIDINAEQEISLAHSIDIAGATQNKRGVLIDGYYYIFSGDTKDNFKVIKM